MGFAGVLLLVRPSGGESFDAAGVAAVLFASVSWAAGSLYARRAPLPARPLVGSGMEMLAGGAVLLVVSAATGEFSDIRFAEISLASLLSVGYLVVFGSLVGFASYAWLLRVARTSLVATYAYVNPVVAVLLGWAILGEAFTLQTILAGLVIVGAVALIVSARGQEPEVAHEGEATAAPPVREEPSEAGRVSA